jgi:hypothetical protein
MSRKTYGGSNINWGSFDEWSNSVSSDSNTSIATAMNDMYPANTSPFSASELANSTIFKGVIRAQTGGTVALTAPYTVTATSGTITLKNVFLNAYNITIVAAATYPWTFHSWRSSTGSGGDQISTSATFTITNSSNADYANYYAYFTTTHLNPYA